MNKSRSVGIQKKGASQWRAPNAQLTFGDVLHVCVSLCLQVNIPNLRVLWAANRIRSDFHLYEGQFKGPIFNIYTGIYRYKME